NRLARNPTSGAYGIPQALPPSKMGAAANPPISSAVAQINWGLGYIKSRYGSPEAAWAHELAYHWYDPGGWPIPRPTLARNDTGQPERVIPAGQDDATASLLSVIAAKLDVVIAAIMQNAGDTADGIADVLGGAARTSMYRAAYSPRG